MSQDLTVVLDQPGVDDVPRAGFAAGRIRVERLALELTVHDDLESIEQEWRQFADHADCTPFQTYEWLSAWCRHVGRRSRVRPAVVIGRGDNGEPLFLFPLAVEPGAVRWLTWLGSDLCDYNAPLLAKGYSARVPAEEFPALWRDIGRALQLRPGHRFDLVALTKMPAMVGGQSNPFMALTVGLNPSHAYVTDLRASWDEYYQAKRSSATRRRDRTKLKRLAEFGAVRFVTPQEPGDIARTVNTLAVQKAGALARMGVANMFARPGWSDFFIDLATDPRTRNLVHVSRLDAGPIPAAINLGLNFRDCYYHVLASYDDGETARFGPGAAHLRELLRYAIERGLARFDFTIGDEGYKREWSDTTVPLYDHVAAADLRGFPAAVLMRAIRRTKRMIKQNEMLWSAVSRLRAALARRSTDAGSPAVPKSPPIAPE
jgi:CelD/BcsL family acetyltransferase involved in cellulose biosynthesis